MSDQLTFPEPSHAARSSDPVTSHIAAESAEFRRNTHKHRLLLAYYQNPKGLTDEEAGIITGLYESRASYWKRCSELRECGYIRTMTVMGQALMRKSRADELQRVCQITVEGIKCINRMGHTEADGVKRRLGLA